MAGAGRLDWMILEVFSCLGDSDPRCPANAEESEATGDRTRTGNRYQLREVGNPHPDHPRFPRGLCKIRLTPCNSRERRVRVHWEVHP